jgi:hypothetical protein
VRLRISAGIIIIINQNSNRNKSNNKNNSNRKNKKTKNNNRINNNKNNNRINSIRKQWPPGSLLLENATDRQTYIQTDRHGQAYKMFYAHATA